MTAYNQAKAHHEHISELLVALNLDYDRYHEAKEELEDIQSEIQITQDSLSAANTEEELYILDNELAELTGTAEELQAEIAEFDSLRQGCEDTDDVMILIMEYPLSIEVRGGWVSVSEFSDAEPEEFCICLCTGGPAVRVKGLLDEDGDPMQAWIEYSDWSTPWSVLDMSNMDVLTFAQQFIYVY